MCGSWPGAPGSKRLAQYEPQINSVPKNLAIKSKIISLVIKSEKIWPLPNKFQTRCCKWILPDASASALKCVSFWSCLLANSFTISLASLILSMRKTSLLTKNFDISSAKITNFIGYSIATIIQYQIFIAFSFPVSGAIITAVTSTLLWKWTFDILTPTDV